jgi:ribosomal protein L22
MSTVLIIVLIVVVVIAVAAAVVFLGPGRGRVGGGSLKRRFGPEYERVVARHGGDTRAAEHELAERVKRHGGFRPRALSPERHESYVAQWAGVQEQFVDSPQKAVAEADRLLAGVAADRGYPASEGEQLDALSVHHAAQVDGFRRVRRAARGEGGTEQMREALVEARALFEALVTDRGADHGSHARVDARGDEYDKHDKRGAQRPRTLGRHAKGSGV